MTQVIPPRVGKSQLLKDRPHNKILYNELISYINKYNEVYFKRDQDAFIRLSLEPISGVNIIIIFASDDYIDDIVNGVKSALLKLELVLLQEEMNGNGRYFIHWEENGKAN